MENQKHPARQIGTLGIKYEGVAVKKFLVSDRGDVPGWVLITLMTAGLVVLIWAFAGPALQGVFEQAMDRVVSF